MGDFIKINFLYHCNDAQSTDAVEYTNCISAEILDRLSILRKFDFSDEINREFFLGGPVSVRLYVDSRWIIPRKS